MTIDVLLFDRIGHQARAQHSCDVARCRSEVWAAASIEIESQVAHALAERGYKVALANGRADAVEEDGVHVRAERRRRQVRRRLRRSTSSA